jgi:hypothetical protein
MPMTNDVSTDTRFIHSAFDSPKEKESRINQHSINTAPNWDDSTAALDYKYKQATLIIIIIVHVCDIPVVVSVVLTRVVVPAC